MVLIGHSGFILTNVSFKNDWNNDSQKNKAKIFNRIQNGKKNWANK